MATLRLRRIRRGKATYRYWVVTWREASRRRERSFPATQGGKAEAALWQAECSRLECRESQGVASPGDYGSRAISVEAWIEGFLAHKAAGAGHSCHYLADMRSRLGAFARWLADQHCAVTTELRAAHLDAYAAHLAEAGQAVHSRQNALVMVRSCVAWGSRAIHGSPARAVLPPELIEAVPHLRIPRQDRPAMRPDEIGRMLEALEGDTIRPVVAAALYTGARLSELIALDWHNVDLGAGLVIIQGESAKNRRSRRIAIHPALRPVLAALDVSRNGRMRVFNLTASHVSHRFHAVMSRLGLGRYHFHDLRHTAATRLAAAGMSLWDLQRVMGWTDPRIAARYVEQHQEHPPSMEGI